VRWKELPLALLGAAAVAGVVLGQTVGGNDGSARDRVGRPSRPRDSPSATAGVVRAIATVSAAATGATTIGRPPPPTRRSHTLIVGTVDDSVKQRQPALASTLMKVSHDAGFDAVLVSSRWRRGATRPSATERAMLGNVVRAAGKQGMQVFVFVWHGLSGGTPRTPTTRRQFASYAAAIVRDFPQIRNVVVGNEPNLNTFWLPQFGSGGRDAAAASYFELLAETYDALKAVSPQIEVIGGALAPRGSDRPQRKRGTHSPTQFIKDLGAAYHASGRTKPIMDAFAIHPYMHTSAVPPTGRNHASTTITIADYPRLVGLLTNTFKGTGQRGRGLPIYYTEFGVQTLVTPAHRHAYTDLNAPGALDAVDPKTQARYYVEALSSAACQPAVRALFILHTFDEQDLRGWQSGLYYADEQPKPSLPPFRLAAAAARAARLTECAGTTSTPIR
jgi:hypothetical protein